jgi:hypothetical protein
MVESTRSLQVALRRTASKHTGDGLPRVDHSQRHYTIEARWSPVVVRLYRKKLTGDFGSGHRMIVIRLPLTSLSGADIAGIVLPEDFESFQSRGATERNVNQTEVETGRNVLEVACAECFPFHWYNHACRSHLTMQCAKIPIPFTKASSAPNTLPESKVLSTFCA